MISPNSVAFLDRDGTINVKAPEGDYVKTATGFTLLPGAAEAIRLLNDAGVKVVVVTNQRGIALGRMTTADLLEIHSTMETLLERDAGAHVDLVLYCPHDKEQCLCRKPHPGMLTEAADRLGGIDADASVMIGDSPSDIAAGEAFGVPSILIGPDVESLYEAVRRFLQARTAMMSVPAND